jgi:hypothetical protein
MGRHHGCVQGPGGVHRPSKTAPARRASSTGMTNAPISWTVSARLLSSLARVLGASASDAAEGDLDALGARGARTARQYRSHPPGRDQPTERRGHARGPRLARAARGRSRAHGRGRSEVRPPAFGCVSDPPSPRVTSTTQSKRTKAPNSNWNRCSPASARRCSRGPSAWISCRLRTRRAPGAERKQRISAVAASEFLLTSRLHGSPTMGVWSLWCRLR